MWTTSLGGGLTYSFDGLTVEFEDMVVSGVRLSAEPAVNPSFVGFSTVSIHLVSSLGSIELSAVSSIRSSAQDYMSLASSQVDISADTAAIAAVDTVTVSASSTEIVGSDVEVTADQVSMYASNDTN